MISNPYFCFISIISCDEQSYWRFTNKIFSNERIDLSLINSILLKNPSFGFWLLHEMPQIFISLFDFNEKEVKKLKEFNDFEYDFEDDMPLDNPLGMGPEMGTEDDLKNDLIKAGADPNARDFLNKSPLDYVQLDSENGPSIAAALKSAGAIEQQPDINRDEIWSRQLLGIDSQENINILEDDLGLLVSEQASLYKLNPIILEDYVKQLFNRQILQELPVTRQDVINWIYAFAAANYSE